MATAHLNLFAEVAIQHSFVLRQAARLSGALWDGGAAVIVFFIVSGFCIHLPFRGGRRLNLPAFLSRRFLRVGIPVLVAMGFAKYVLKDASGLMSVTWSIFCEIIYYAIYPALRVAARWIKWNGLIAISSIAAFGVGLFHALFVPNAGYGYWSLGAGLTWLIGLPCWLLGCELAETIDKIKPPSSFRLWNYRVGIFALSALIKIARFHVHSPLMSFYITLDLFAFPAFFWLRSEIAYFRTRRPSAILEWMGTWSYSLYLMHPICWSVLITFHLSWISAMIDTLHFTVVIVAACISYLFYIGVEKPSHLLAIKVSRAWAQASR